MTPFEVLELRFMCGDLDREVSIREWLVELLESLWGEGESFSGKRPFGNSGWQWDPAPTLIQAGVIEGKLDEEGFVDEVDEDALQDTIRSAILALLDLHMPETQDNTGKTG